MADRPIGVIDPIASEPLYIYAAIVNRCCRDAMRGLRANFDFPCPTCGNRLVGRRHQTDVGVSHG